MRIFLLPLSTRQALVYCHRTPVVPSAKLGIIDRIQRKASQTWSDWEIAEKGWKKRLVTYGNNALQRIPYQEWALKSFPPSNPKLQAEQVTDGRKFDVVFPENIVDREDVPKILARLAKERKTLHWNRFIGSMIAIPFTVPFGIIPVIPNIPFFYAVYRCWSHWRALKGSDHLEFILDHRLFKLQSTPEIEGIYQQVAPKLHKFCFITRSQIEAGTDPKEEVLLPRGSHSLVAKAMELPELGTEAERAILQVQRALQAESGETSKSFDNEPSVDKEQVQETKERVGK